MKKEYPANYRDADVEILERLSVIETVVKIHAPCQELKDLRRVVWGGLITILVILIPLAIKSL